VLLNSNLDRKRFSAGELVPDALTGQVPQHPLPMVPFFRPYPLSPSPFDGIADTAAKKKPPFHRVSQVYRSSGKRGLSFVVSINLQRRLDAFAQPSERLLRPA
jgi:hypothetical protein